MRALESRRQLANGTRHGIRPRNMCKHRGATNERPLLLRRIQRSPIAGKVYQNTILQMKARVKETGEIVEVAYHGLGVYVDMNQWDKEYQFDEIVVLDNGDPDYWTRLEHQYAGMAMQAMLTSPELMQVVTRAEKLLTKGYAEKVAIVADKYAHALVEKMKEADR